MSSQVSSVFSKDYESELQKIKENNIKNNAADKIINVGTATIVFLGIVFTAAVIGASIGGFFVTPLVSFFGRSLNYIKMLPYGVAFGGLPGVIAGILFIMFMTVAIYDEKQKELKAVKEDLKEYVEELKNYEPKKYEENFSAFTFGNRINLLVEHANAHKTYQAFEIVLKILNINNGKCIRNLCRELMSIQNKEGDEAFWQKASEYANLCYENKDIDNFEGWFNGLIFQTGRQK